MPEIVYNLQEQNRKNYWMPETIAATLQRFYNGLCNGQQPF